MKRGITITDKKLFEKLLLDEDKKQLIFHNMLNGFALHEMIYDENGKAIDYKYLSTNPSFTRITGIKNPTGKNVKEIFPDLDYSWIDLFSGIVDTGVPVRIQKYQLDSDKWYDISGFKVRDKEFAVFFTDITLFKKSEQKIKENLMITNTLLDAIPHPALLVDINRIVLAANEKAKNMGAQIGEFCYRGFSTCSQFCNEGENCLFCKKSVELDDMDSKHLEIDVCDNVWDTWWVPVNNNSFLHYAVDITSIKQKERIVIESAKELKASNLELEQFAYVASHDLQEPLRVVSTYCQLIERFIKDNFYDLEEDKKKELDQYLNFTVDATTRMRYLIKDLLEFSRVGRTDDNYEMIDIEEVLQTTIKDFDISIKEHNVIIKYTDMPIIMGKRRRVGQIFHNLISNAIKFRSDREVVINIAVQEKQNDWLFSVSDTGIGIDKKQRERIFGIFKRLHSREEYPGTGIGLAVVKKIVENHGGEIWVESDIDVGSTFLFTIPKSWEIITNNDNT